MPMRRPFTALAASLYAVALLLESTWAHSVVRNIWFALVSCSVLHHPVCTFLKIHLYYTIRCLLQKHATPTGLSVIMAFYSDSCGPFTYRMGVDLDGYPGWHNMTGLAVVAAIQARATHFGAISEEDR